MSEAEAATAQCTTTVPPEVCRVAVATGDALPVAFVSFVIALAVMVPADAAANGVALIVSGNHGARRRNGAARAKRELGRGAKCGGDGVRKRVAHRGRVGHGQCSGLLGLIVSRQRRERELVLLDLAGRGADLDLCGHLARLSLQCRGDARRPTWSLEGLKFVQAPHCMVSGASHGAVDDLRDVAGLGIAPGCAHARPAQA